MEGFARRTARHKGPLRDQVTGTDARMWHRTDGKAHRGPFGMEIVLHELAFGAFYVEGVERGEVRLQGRGEAVVPHTDREPLAHCRAPLRASIPRSEWSHAPITKLSLTGRRELGPSTCPRRKRR